MAVEAGWTPQAKTTVRCATRALKQSSFDDEKKSLNTVAR